MLNDDDLVESWKVVSNNSKVRQSITQLQRLKGVLANQKLINAGLTSSTLTDIINTLNANPSLYSVLSNTGEGLEKFLYHLEKIGSLPANPPGFTNFGLVISGLKETNPVKLRGHIFRLRACEEYGWSNILALEATEKGRYIDIRSITDLRIETKYYATFEKKTSQEINDYLTQIRKDIDNAYPFEHWFSKSGTITSETQLHQEIKDILTNKTKGYDNDWFNDIKRGLSESGLNSFISSKFKFKDFNQ